MPKDKITEAFEKRLGNILGNHLRATMEEVMAIPELNAMPEESEPMMAQCPDCGNGYFTDDARTQITKRKIEEAIAGRMLHSKAAKFIEWLFNWLDKEE